MRFGYHRFLKLPIGVPNSPQLTVFWCLFSFLNIACCNLNDVRAAGVRGLVQQGPAPVVPLPPVPGPRVVVAGHLLHHLQSDFPFVEINFDADISPQDDHQQLPAVAGSCEEDR